MTHPHLSFQTTFSFVLPAKSRHPRDGSSNWDPRIEYRRSTTASISGIRGIEKSPNLNDIYPIQCRTPVPDLLGKLREEDNTTEQLVSNRSEDTQGYEHHCRVEAKWHISHTESNLACMYQARICIPPTERNMYYASTFQCITVQACNKKGGTDVSGWLNWGGRSIPFPSWSSFK